MIPRTRPPTDPKEMRRWVFFSKMAPLTVIASFETWPTGGGMLAEVHSACGGGSKLERENMDLGSGMACAQVGSQRVCAREMHKFICQD